MEPINERYITDSTSEEVKNEIADGLKLLEEIKEPIITFFGSHVGEEGEKEYDRAYESAKALAADGFGIMSGGGPGIMHAANKGAMSEGVSSIGVMADLLVEERINDEIFTHKIAFKYMFVRRFILSIKSRALVFFPGGYGTLNELFEFVVLMQTGMVDKVPIILVNREFWKGMKDWINTLKEQKYIGDGDLELLHYADTVDEIQAIVPDMSKKED